jgi:cbb3-type cytochrome oxidase maturation protein
MNVLVFLIPISLVLGGGWLACFLWAAKRGQFNDPLGDASRIVRSEYDDKPKD